MNPNDPNLKLVEEVADVLGDLMDRLTLVGGCAAGLLITDPAQPRIRATNDVDVVVETVTLSGYYEIERKLEDLGLTHDQSEDAPICRWRVGSTALDLMPAQEGLLDFSNPWYQHAVTSAWPVTLESGARVRVISAPAFVASKLTAFEQRGGGDYLASHDLEDVIAVIDGRTELIDEVAQTDDDLREFVANRLRTMLAEPRFVQALPGHLPPDSGSQGRLPQLKRSLQVLAGMA